MRIGVLGGFLVLLVIAWLALTSANVPSRAQEPTPYEMPTLPPSPTPLCAGAPRNRLIVYERGRVTADDPLPLNVREGPETSFEIIGSIPANGIFFVLAGPECSARYAWYRVRYADIEGWIAEGAGTSYFVEPYLPG
mgnify:CR=1 FL=1